MSVTIRQVGSATYVVCHLPNTYALNIMFEDNVMTQVKLVWEDCEDRTSEVFDDEYPKCKTPKDLLNALKLAIEKVEKEIIYDAFEDITPN